MAHRRAMSERVTYVYLALLNVGVLGMFLVIFSPGPDVRMPIVATVYHHKEVPMEAPVAKPVIGEVKRVVVPSVGIDSTVQSGSYNTDTHAWSISDQSAFHADTTVPVNNTNGTSLIYGHARWSIFGRLPEVGKGAEAVVYTLEGYRFVYTFASSRQVDPSDTSALTSHGPPTLLLQTCSGAFDAYRTLVAFHLKEVVRDE